MKPMDLSNKEISKIDQSIHWVCRNQRKNWNYKDIQQELWVAAMEAVKKLDEFHITYIQKTCYNRLITLMKQKEYCFLSREIPCENEVLLHLIGADTPESALEIESILEMFPESSKPREYIQCWLEVLGLTETSNEVPEKGVQDYIAKKIGYSSRHSSGYVNFVKKVSQQIKSML